MFPKMTECNNSVLETTKNMVRIHFCAIFNARCSYFESRLSRRQNVICSIHFKWIKFEFVFALEQLLFYCTSFQLNIETKGTKYEHLMLLKKVSYKRQTVSICILYHKSHWKMNERMPAFLLHLPISFPFHSQ